MSVKEGVDPLDLSQTGWGVIFAHDADPAIRNALEPLLMRRREHATRINEHRYKEYADADGYQTNDTKSLFFSRHSISPGPADPGSMPYYLLIVGDPATIPFDFQYQLALQRAVGRVSFEKPEDYANYARSVVEYETKSAVVANKAVFFAPQIADDRATAEVASELAKPLATQMANDATAWSVRTVIGAQATKAGLARLLGGDQTPDLLFLTSHGASFPLNDARQASSQGAIICQDWPGPSHGDIQPGYYFAAEDLGSNARLSGLIAFLVSACSVGTPLADEYSSASVGRSSNVSRQLALQPFISRLPQRMLAHPNGGALAVIGVVDRPWTVSFLPPWGSLAMFRDGLQYLYEGYPAGYVLEPFKAQYAELDSRLAEMQQEMSRFGKLISNPDLASLRIATTAARNYVLFGDPAVRLPQVERVAAPAIIVQQIADADIDQDLIDLGALVDERAPALRQQFEEKITALEAAWEKDGRQLGASSQPVLTDLDDLCQEVLEITFSEIAQGGKAPEYMHKCPFLGFEKFHESERDFFFGRTELVKQLQQTIARSRFLAVIGPSGCGKTRLIFGGVVPALKEQSPNLHVVSINPELDPLGQLSKRLDEIGDHGGILIVDPLENLFNRAVNEESRGKFLNCLLELVALQNDASDPADNKLKVVVILRSDRWEDCKPYPYLFDTLQANLVNVDPMQRNALRQTIEQQSAEARLQFEPGLLDQILDDVLKGPGAMSLLSHTLQSLWDRRHGRWLKKEEYHALGDASKIIISLARTFYADIASTEQGRMLDIFIRLAPHGTDVEPSAKGDETRRNPQTERLIPIIEFAASMVHQLPAEAREHLRDVFVRLEPGVENANSVEQQDNLLPILPLHELVPFGEDPTQTMKIVRQLADARLLVTDCPQGRDRVQVTLAHAALSDVWARLNKEWMKENENYVKLRQRIGVSAKQWVKAGQDPSFLVHRGESLVNAQMLSQRIILHLNQVEHDYVEACSNKERKELNDANQAKQEMEALRKAAQDSEKAKAALDALVTRFREMEALHLELARLIELVPIVQDLQREFGNCIALVEQAGLNYPTLDSNKYAERWKPVHPWLTRLEVYASSGRGEIDISSWFDPLQKQATRINQDLAESAQKALSDRAKEFDKLLTEADSQLQMKVQRTIERLTMLMNRALGGLVNQ